MNKSTASTSPDNDVHISLSLLLILTVAAGLSVANIYYNQSMLVTLSKAFNASPSSISIIPILTQVGYAFGLFFLSSLGDRFERKRLIIITMFLLGTSLLLTAIVPNLIWLSVMSLIVGVLATVTQQIVPFAVHLSSPQKRGKVIGTVICGVLLGILLSRTISGYVTENYGWRAMFCLAAALMYIVTIVLAFLLPKIQRTTAVRYHELISSMFGLFRSHYILRQASLTQGILFSAFIAF